MAVLASTIHLAQARGGSTTSLLISLALMGAIFYFLLIRPQQRRMRQQRALITSLDVGDEVVTIGGMYGTIQSLDEEAVTVEVSPGVSVRLLKSAIARKVSTSEGADGGDDAEAGATGEV